MCCLTCVTTSSPYRALGTAVFCHSFLHFKLLGTLYILTASSTCLHSGSLKKPVPSILKATSWPLCTDSHRGREAPNNSNNNQMLGTFQATGKCRPWRDGLDLLYMSNKWAKGLRGLCGYPEVDFQESRRRPMTLRCQISPVECRWNCTEDHGVGRGRRDKINIAMIQETKLRSCTATPRIQGYKSIRADRPREVIRGGLLFYIRDSEIL